MTTYRAVLTVLFLTSTAVAVGQQRDGVLRVIFVDQSDSQHTEDAVRWVKAAETCVFAPLRFGDAVLVYGVHDHTAESAPIFEAAVPMVAPDAGMDIVLPARKVLRQARENGITAIRAALSAPARSRSTRLVESLTRIPRDGWRSVEVLYLSDMLESTRELDLERTAITDGNVARSAQGVIDRYRLRRGLLDGVTIRVVLDSPAVGTKRVVANNHSALDRFWRLLITGLGGKLAAFDSRVQ